MWPPLQPAPVLYAVARQHEQVRGKMQHLDSMHQMLMQTMAQKEQELQTGGSMALGQRPG